MKDRQVVGWCKDDIKALKFMKVDVMALGMLTCMAKSFELPREHKDIPMGLSDVEQEDPATYAMIRKANTLGTFQIESLAPDEGKEKIQYPTREREDVLGKTLGVPLILGERNEGRHDLSRIYGRRGGPVASRDGDVQVHGRGQQSLVLHHDETGCRQGCRTGYGS